MARTRAQSAAQGGYISSEPRDQGKRPQGIRKRKSWHAARRPQRRVTASRTVHDQPRSSPATKSSPQNASILTKRGTKRRIDERDDDNLGIHKRARRSSKLSPVTRLSRYGGVNEPVSPVAFWAREGKWPQQYFETEMDHLLARKKSLPSLNRKRSSSASSATPSDQRPREEKSAPYRDPRYKTLLATKGSFMDESDLGITEQSKTTYFNLLGSDQKVPEMSLFRDDLFKQTCRRVEDRNEARVIRDLTPLIVPPAENLCIYGAKHLDVLIESVNEGWNNSISLTSTRPQPDYSVGFRREAFSDKQLAKLSPFIGDFLSGDQSLFMATYYMYFPFLTCEVKCGAAALDVADRQNAHSMTLAVRAIAELFRAVKREGEVNRQILAFSISHDHCTVRISGHYPVMKDGEDIKYYRHLIRKFDFTELDGKEKWTAYQFTKNVYDLWMPSHFKRICSAIDELPSDMDFNDPSLPATGLSQSLESHHLSLSDVASLPIEDDTPSSNAKPEVLTPSTSFTDHGAAKKRKGRK
ncbi:hypothetical protein V8C37DRAFT_392091 [Trichoderma ceciliae]